MKPRQFGVDSFGPHPKARKTAEGTTAGSSAQGGSAPAGSSAKPSDDNMDTSIPEEEKAKLVQETIESVYGKDQSPEVYASAKSVVDKLEEARRARRPGPYPGSG